MKYATKILHNGSEWDPYTGALSIPIYQTSTFHQHDIEHPGRYDYSRSQNPTREALENTLAALEGGTRGFAFASGMAAVSSALSIFNQGDHIIATEDIYGGSYRVLTKFFNKFGLEVTFVDMTDLNQVERAVRESTKAILMESPTNPLLKVTDIAGVVALAKRHNLLTLIDNTFMSPYFQRPLELGVDIVIHSATKFLGGHSDVIGGAVIVGSEALASQIYFVQNSFGAVQGPQDAWLILRGIKTLRARMEFQQQSAIAIAKWLQGEDWVEKVYYPGLPEHPGHDRIRAQASGFGAIVSFKTDTPERAIKIMRNVRLWSVAVSLGGVESILSYPARMSHASIPRAERERLGVSDNLLRLSVGLEDADDLIEDLRQANDGLNDRLKG